MTEMSAETNVYQDAGISVEFGDDVDECFEVYMDSSDNPASSSSDSEESVSKDANENEDSASSDIMSPIVDLVKSGKWAILYASVEENKDLAKRPITIPSTESAAVAKEELLLHFVCKNNAPAPIVECVLKANPEAVSTPGHGGYLPLHYACEAGAAKVVVEILLDAYPGSIKVLETEKSRLPLHLATRNEGSATTAEGIALLLSYYPEAAFSQDADGKRPIDYVPKTKNTNKKARWEIMSVLEMGEKWINVGKNVTLRLEEDFAERLRAMEKNFGNYVESLKAVHDEEIAKIANDLLEIEHDRELMTEELKLDKEEDAWVDTDLQAKVDAIVKKHDKFLILQEESRMQRLNLDAEDMVEPTEKDEKPAAPVETPTETEKKEETVVMNKKTVESQSNFIEKLALKVLEKKAIARLEPTFSEKEKVLMARITVLEKAQRLKAGIIKRLIGMAKMQEKKQHKHIVILVSVIDEQRRQLDSLLAKLDLCEEQIQLLKDRVEVEA